MARDDADRALLSLGAFAQVEPPAWLDNLVQQRVGEQLEQRRSALGELTARGQPAAGVESWKRPSQTMFPLVPTAKPGVRGLRRAEVWAYACGFLAYAAQLADGLGWRIWHALTG